MKILIVIYFELKKREVNNQMITLQEQSVSDS